MVTPFRLLAELCERFESTSKRKEMVNFASRFLIEIESEEVAPAISMLMGRPFPKWDQRVLEVSWSAISSAVRAVATVDNHSLSNAFGQTGDVGDAVKKVLSEGEKKQQQTLTQYQLTILEVRRIFEAIAEVTGSGSREKKQRLLETLIASATPLEAKIIVRILTQEMRTGFYEGLMEKAVAETFQVPLETVQTSSMLTGDIAEIGALLKRDGVRALDNITLKMFRPIKSMLAQNVDSVGDALAEHGGRTVFEFKLDGARIQIHKLKEEVKIFSRQLTEVTQSLPEIVEIVRKNVGIDSVVLEGEVIAVGPKGNPMPFQNLMRRFRRIQRINQVAKLVPVQLYLFDILYLNGKHLINEPYKKRRNILSKIAKGIPLVKQSLIKNTKEAKRFFEQAISEGHEGLMAKKPNTSYTPGIRGKKWLKIKKILEPLDLVIVAAEYGYGRRHGWLSDYHLAAHDKETGELLPIGKTFKGLTDAEIIEMTKKLKDLKIREKGHIIEVLPKIVVEVAYNEIQKSPKYKCGMALRFARITRIRNEKNVEDIDTIQRIRQIYEQQFEKKARYP